VTWRQAQAAFIDAEAGFEVTLFAVCVAQGVYYSAIGGWLLGGDMVKIDLRAIQLYKAQDERV
jgi:hypothetical protein